MDISNNNMITLAHVRVSNSEVNIYISYCVASQNVHIFKYSATACDYGVFDNQADACEFIASELPDY
jgi:hypothetical protein